MPDPSKRWLFLLFTSLTYCCTQSVVDQISVLKARLQGTAEECHDGTDPACLDFTSAQFNGLYVSHFWFGAAGALSMGFLIGKFGIYMSSWLSAGLLLVGMAFITVGPYCHRSSSAFAIMLTGRGIYAMGYFGNTVISHEAKSHWFRGRELALSFAIYVTSGRLGAVITYASVGVIVTRFGLQTTLWIIFAVGLLGTACAVITGWLYQRYGIAAVDPATFRHSSVDWNFGKVLLLGRDFWLLCFIIFFFFNALSTYLADGPKFLIEVYGYSEAAAGLTISIIPFVALIAPLVGFLIDRFGRRTTFISVALTFCLLGFIIQLLAVSYLTVVVCILVGGSYCVMTSGAASSVPLVVGHDKVGVAMGVGLGIQAFGSGLTLLITGFVLDNATVSVESRWTTFFVILISFAATAWVLSLVLMFFDFKYEHRRLHVTHRLPAVVAEMDKEVGEITPLLK